MNEVAWGEYLRAKEPGVREKAYAWKTAIGLQKVDGLTSGELHVYPEGRRGDDRVSGEVLPQSAAGGKERPEKPLSDHWRLEGW